MAIVHTVLPFVLRDQRFALPAGLVKRVLPALAVLPLPAAPAGVAGICEVHGKVVAVMDLRARLGWPPASLNPWAHWIWLRTSRRELLLPVDHSEPVCRIGGALQPVSALQGSDTTVMGVLRAPDGLYLLQDVESFLSPVDGQTLDEALAHHARG